MTALRMIIKDSKIVTLAELKTIYFDLLKEVDKT